MISKFKNVRYLRSLSNSSICEIDEINCIIENNNSTIRETVTGQMVSINLNSMEPTFSCPSCFQKITCKTEDFLTCDNCKSMSLADICKSPTYINVSFKLEGKHLLQLKVSKSLLDSTIGDDLDTEDDRTIVYAKQVLMKSYKICYDNTTEIFSINLV